MKNYIIAGIVLSSIVTYGYAADAAVTNIEAAVEALIAKSISQQEMISLNEAIVDRLNQTLEVLEAKKTVLLAEINRYEAMRSHTSTPRLSALLAEFDDELSSESDEGQDE